jgi:type I restriction enzyme S subunit
LRISWHKFGDVLRLERRDPELSIDEARVEIGIKSFGRGVFHKPPVSRADLGAKRVFRVREGDLLISNVFAWEGAIAVAGPSEEGMIGSHRFMTWVPNGGGVHVPYIRDYLLTGRGLQAIGKASPGSAGRNRTLGLDALKLIDIPLPSIAKQRSIAARLKRLSLVAGALSEARASGASPDEIAPAIVTQVLGELSLPGVPVGDLYDVVNDVVHPGDDLGEATRFVGLQHVARHVGLRTGSSDVDDLTGRKLRFLEGDVTYGYLRPYLNKVWVADGPGLCSVEQFVLRPRSGVDPRLLGHVLRQQATLDAVNAATHNLQLPRIRGGLLAQIQVPDIRLARGSHADHLDLINDRAMQATQLATRSRGLVASLLPVARNEEFRKLLAA